MQTNEATSAPTPGPSGRPNRTGAEPRRFGQAPLAFRLLWYASRRRHAPMTMPSLVAIPALARATRGVA